MAGADEPISDSEKVCDNFLAILTDFLACDFNIMWLGHLEFEIPGVPLLEMSE